MANLGGLVTWVVGEYPNEARILVNRQLLPITEEVLRMEVFTGEPFTLIYPISPKGGYTLPVTYDPEGIPFTMADLLNTMYYFYQQRATKQDIQNAASEARYVADMRKGSKTFSDLLEDRRIFWGRFIEVDPDTYEVILSI